MRLIQSILIKSSVIGLVCSLLAAHSVAQQQEGCSGPIGQRQVRDLRHVQVVNCITNLEDRFIVKQVESRQLVREHRRNLQKRKASTERSKRNGTDRKSRSRNQASRPSQPSASNSNGQSVPIHRVTCEAQATTRICQPSYQLFVPDFCFSVKTSFGIGTASTQSEAEALAIASCEFLPDTKCYVTRCR